MLVCEPQRRLCPDLCAVSRLRWFNNENNGGGHQLTGQIETTANKLYRLEDLDTDNLILVGVVQWGKWHSVYKLFFLKYVYKNTKMFLTA